MKIPKYVAEAFDAEKNLYFGTSSKCGIPNVVIIGSRKIVSNDTIWVIDTYFGKTMKNILENPNVTICVHHGREAAFQIKGKATHITKGKEFEEARDWILKYKPKKIVKGLVKIKVTEIYNLTPGYDTAGKKIA